MGKQRTVESVLREALLYLRKHGWCQHCLQAHNGKVCLDGAVRYAIWGDPLHPAHSVIPDEPHRRLYADTMHTLSTKTGKYGPPLWNDRYERTQDEVEDLLKSFLRPDLRYDEPRGRRGRNGGIV